MHIHPSFHAPSLNMVSVLSTPAVWPRKGVEQVVDNKMAGDTGSGPVTSILYGLEYTEQRYLVY